MTAGDGRAATGGGEDGPGAGDAEAEAFREDVREEARREIHRDRLAEAAARPGHRGPADGETAVEVRDVGLSYGGETVLSAVSFRVQRGETLSILGGSGAGKSTLLRLVLALDRPDSGRVLVEGRDVTEAPRPEVLEIRRRMGMVFQASALFDSLSVYDNVAFALHQHTQMAEERVSERVREVLTFVDLDPDRVRDLLPAQLSGGMKKRVAIARAIVHSPEILLFDEPTSGLDPITTRTINELLVKLRGELRVTSVVVTHDIRSAFRISNRVALLYGGEIVFQGSPEEMLASEDEYVHEFLR
ncbi:MAG: ABC transporter ATP-binding protein [Gemmatimonadota bacterium]